MSTASCESDQGTEMAEEVKPGLKKKKKEVIYMQSF